jgi:uncharacterized protein
MKISAACASFGLLLSFSALAGADVKGDCHVGSYRLIDGRAVDVAPSDSNNLRWRTFTGETGHLHPQADGTWASTYGWTDRPDGEPVSFSDCDKGEIIFGNESGRRIAFDVRDAVFESNGVMLVGRLIMPKGSGKVPVVVLVHGSEHDSALDSYALQRMFPAQGIGAFVYDKRGTGASGGSYTQDFDVLADDAVAAMKEAKRLAGPRLERIGYQGGSEGGWVVPLAANRAPVDFAIVSFGLAVTVLEEDQESVALDMYFHNHSTADTAKAQGGLQSVRRSAPEIQVRVLVQGCAWRFRIRHHATRPEADHRLNCSRVKFHRHHAIPLRANADSARLHYAATVGAR